MINQIEMDIWGRTFTLPIEYDCYGEETVTEAQEKALKTFTAHSDWLSVAKGEVERYCSKQIEEDDKIVDKGNIFSYIKPECVFIKRDKEHPRVALMCKYRYDLEHGLVIVFFADGSVVVGTQEIIL